MNNNTVQRRISVAEPDLSGNEVKYITKAILKDGRVSSSGYYLDKFKHDFSAFCNRKYALATSNGTTALHLALIGLGIGPGDEVIVPTFTFVATAAVVRHVGATPVFVDSKEEDWTLDEKMLDKVKTPRTKAIISVDIYGVPCDYDYIEKWCKKNKVFLIEDAAEAHGGKYKNRMVGSFGDISCFSFYGNKIITTGEGGMCLTNNPKLYEKMRVLKHHGMLQAGVYLHKIVGYNYRMTNIQAAIGCAQFERIDSFIKKRKDHDLLYKELLKDVPGISFQPIKSTATPSYWFFNVIVSKNVDLIRKLLSEKGIETRPLFIPLHSQKVYKEFSKGKKFPVADNLHKSGLTLPSSPKLTNSDLKYIANSLKEIINKLNSKKS
jgi:perosamine synthetase